MEDFKVWKKLDIYDGRYYINNLGEIGTKYNNKTKKMEAEITLLNPYIQQLKAKSPFFKIGLTVSKTPKKQKTFYIHRLVAENFLEGKTKYSLVLFKDKNTLNTRANNLIFKSTGRDNIFKNNHEQIKYIRKYEKIFYKEEDIAILELMKGNASSIITILYKYSVLNYIGKTLIDKGYKNTSELRDTIKDFYDDLIPILKSGAYRPEKQEARFLAFIASCLKISMYKKWKKEVYIIDKSDNNENIVNTYNKEVLNKNQSFSYFTDLSQEINLMFES